MGKTKERVKSLLKSVIWRLCGVVILVAVTFAYTRSWMQMGLITLVHFLKTMTIKSIKKDLRVLEIGAGDLKICKQILGNKSSPFTFRSHNPTDYWRFTADGSKHPPKNPQECSVYSTYLNEQERAEHLPLSMFVLAKN